MKLSLLILSLFAVAARAAEELTVDMTLYFEGPSKLVLNDADHENFKQCFISAFDDTHKKLNHQAWTMDSLEVQGPSFYTGVRRGHNHMPMREPHFPNIRKRVDQQKAVDFLVGFSSASLQQLGSPNEEEESIDAECGLCAPPREEFSEMSDAEKEILVAERQWMTEMCDCLDAVFIHGHSCWVEFHDFW